ncbi:MAG: energy transducer TonB [Gemmatimonadaceae bacterium]
MHWRDQCIIALAATLAACASAPRTDPAIACLLASADSVFLSGGPVYRDCAVTRRAQLLNRTAHPDFRPNISSGQSCYSADIQFVVDATGTPEEENATIVRATDPAFGQAALAAVMRWSYKPAQLHDVSVRQIVREKVAIAAVVVAVPMGQTPRPPDHLPKC